MNRENVGANLQARFGKADTGNGAETQVGIASATCTHYRDVKIAQTAKFFTNMRTKYELHLCQQCNGFLLHKIKNVLPAEVKAYRAPEILESDGTSKKP